MEKARLNIVTSKLVGNTGQLEWLPRNPRQWTAADVDRTVKSITEDADFLEDRPLLAVPAESGKGERACAILDSRGVILNDSELRGSCKEHSCYAFGFCQGCRTQVGG